jgi:hypothetical protein
LIADLICLIFWMHMNPIWVQQTVGNEVQELDANACCVCVCLSLSLCQQACNWWSLDLFFFTLRLVIWFFLLSPNWML